MPNFNDVYTSSYLKAGDLQGRRKVVQITAVETAKFQDGKSALQMSFANTDKKFTLNKINCVTIASLLGSDDTDDWIGHKIILRPDKTQNPSGQIVDCIRVDSELPEEKQAQRTPPRAADVRPPQPVPELEDDSIPF